MAGTGDPPHGPGDGGPPSDDAQEIIRRARAKIEELRHTPKADKSLQDRMLSELGVEDIQAGRSGPTGPSSPGKDD